MKRANMVSVMLLCTALLLSGCGASPTEETTQPAIQETVPETTREVPDVDIPTDLAALTAAPRPIGSAGENDAVQYLRRRFQDMGYEVTLQGYTDELGRTGSNVIAAKALPNPQADIFILSAHHDSAPSAYGASDNASGVAALLQAAQALKDLPTDTELRFISFTDEENGKNGSRAYVASLTQEEKGRVVGCIQFDMLGGLGTDGMVSATLDGQSNWVCDLLQRIDPTMPRQAEAASDHASLQLAGIPSVLLTQNGRGYLYHSAADTAGTLDLEAIAAGADLAVEAAAEIASPGTASYQALAREQGEGYTYRQTRQNVIYFQSSLADTEACIGAAGELVDTREIVGDGWTDVYETYRYDMLWFDGEQPIHTYYQYRNGYLQYIELRPEETGYTGKEVRGLIAAMYGKPDTDTGDGTGWSDPIYSKYITLSGDDAGTLVTVSSFSVGVSNVLASYPVAEGEAKISGPEDRAVWERLCAILPLEARQKIARFDLFTDGRSNILAFTAPIQENGVTDNSRFSMSIDYYDVYDENGTLGDMSKLTATILHEYGHVLLEDETQIDLSAAESTHDPAGFIDGSFRKGFYDKFWAELGASAVGDYEQNPTHYVSRYGANYFHEDIADTFAMFVLGDQPTGATVAAEKLRFFWADEAMVALRTTIRQNLDLPV